MTAARPRTAVGVFHTRGDAENAVQALRHSGFADDRIGFIARNQPSPFNAAAGGASGDPGVHNAATGAVAGGTLGTLAGLAVGALLIPAFGPVLVGGALLGVLATAVAGAAAGGAAGALIGLGLSEEDASYYQNELGAGRFLVTVQADDRYDDAVATLRHCGAYGRGSPLV
jgi:hypothetical protein